MTSPTSRQNLAWSCAIALVLAGMFAGCAPERPESVPADAKSVAKQGGMNPMNFTAPQDGSAYVYDRTSQKMVYTGRIKRGESLQVDPRRDGVLIDGRKVVDAKLRDLNEYQVWFDAEPEAVQAQSVAPRSPIIIQTAPPPPANTGSTINVQTAPPAASSTASPTTPQTGTSTTPKAATPAAPKSDPPATPPTEPATSPEADSPTAPRGDSSTTPPGDSTAPKPDGN